MTVDISAEICRKKKRETGTLNEKRENVTTELQKSELTMPTAHIT